MNIRPIPPARFGFRLGAGVFFSGPGALCLVYPIYPIAWRGRAWVSPLLERSGSSRVCLFGAWPDRVPGAGARRCSPRRCVRCCLVSCARRCLASSWCVEDRRRLPGVAAWALLLPGSSGAWVFVRLVASGCKSVLPGKCFIFKGCCDVRHVLGRVAAVRLLFMDTRNSADFVLWPLGVRAWCRAWVYCLGVPGCVLWC